MTNPSNRGIIRNAAGVVSNLTKLGLRGIGASVFYINKGLQHANNGMGTVLTETKTGYNAASQEPESDPVQMEFDFDNDQEIGR